MEAEEMKDRVPITAEATAAQFADEPSQDEVRAWEQVDAGRFMPRRIKGSCKGRALG
jgi:hypothetical protein